ncbi:predicted protein [Postia placenta Mad-698-R]|nr:predicted protein [Postia placenta Mad-698-R]
MFGPLPLDISWMIIDELRSEHDYDTLNVCAAVCQGWKQRASKYIPLEMTFTEPDDVGDISVKRRLRWRGPSKVRIEGGKQSGERLPIPHLATFASRLAEKWTRVEELRIERAEWRMQDVGANTVFLDLSCFFTSITYLRLYDVTFPTVLSFYRLILALPRLNGLNLHGIQIDRAALDDARILSVFRLLPASKLRSISLMPPEGSSKRPGSSNSSVALLQSIATIMDSPIGQTTRSLKRSPWRKVWQLELEEVNFTSAASFACILDAFPALEWLVIKGSCTFVEHGLDTSLRPGMLSQLTFVSLGRDCCLLSDSLSMTDLVDLFIKSGASNHLRGLNAWVSLPHRAPTSINIAISRLVKRAGQSLRELNLTTISQSSIHMYNEALMRMNSGTGTTTVP